VKRFNPDAFSMPTNLAQAVTLHGLAALAHEAAVRPRQGPELASRSKSGLAVPAAKASLKIRPAILRCENIAQTAVVKTAM
jgi:hypothetical protein